MTTLATLLVSIVTYRPDLELLRTVLAKLAQAASTAQSSSILGRVMIRIADNGPGSGWQAELDELVAATFGQHDLIDASVMSGHGNVGYGRANNLAMDGQVADYGLVLNPDVLLNEQTLAQAVTFMEKYSTVSLLAPKVFDARGDVENLCKRYPTVLDLALRGFAPTWLRRRFADRLAAYEMHDMQPDRVNFDVPLVSGCFMFFRMAKFREVNGFSKDFFMYFEDFDLSLRLSKVGSTAYVPMVSVIHFGGGASRKGWRHILMFVTSAIRFFNKHGWRWA